MQSFAVNSLRRLSTSSGISTFWSINASTQNPFKKIENIDDEEPDDLRPSWSDRGERSLLSAVQDLKEALSFGEEIVVVIDERDGRDAVRAIRADITTMGTRTFIRWMEEDFGIAAASTAWQAIRLATSNTADEGEDDDPVYVRSGP